MACTWTTVQYYMYVSTLISVDSLRYLRATNWESWGLVGYAWPGSGVSVHSVKEEREGRRGRSCWHRLWALVGHCFFPPGSNLITISITKHANKSKRRVETPNFLHRIVISIYYNIFILQSFLWCGRVLSQPAPSSSLSLSTFTSIEDHLLH